MESDFDSASDFESWINVIDVIDVDTGSDINPELSMGNEMSLDGSAFEDAVDDPWFDDFGLGSLGFIFFAFFIVLRSV